MMLEALIRDLIYIEMYLSMKVKNGEKQQQPHIGL